MRRTSKVSSVHEVHDTDTSDEGALAQLGYEQELKRNWSFIHNFGVSFSIISIVTGTTTLFGYGLATGGPAVMAIGWVVVLFFTMFVGLGMAEICSGYPNAGKYLRQQDQWMDANTDDQRGTIFLVRKTLPLSIRISCNSLLGRPHWHLLDILHSSHGLLVGSIS
jgi:amino acid permease